MAVSESATAERTPANQSTRSDLNWEKASMAAGSYPRTRSPLSSILLLTILPFTHFALGPFPT